MISYVILVFGNKKGRNSDVQVYIKIETLGQRSLIKILQIGSEAIDLHWSLCRLVESIIDEPDNFIKK